MVSSQSVVGNRKPKLFSLLNELYGSARTVPRASDNYTGCQRYLILKQDSLLRLGCRAR